MNSLEDRIRAAAKAAGDTVRPDSVPPLKLRTDHMTSAHLATGASRWPRLLAPVAAAVAVVAVVAGAVLASGAVHNGTAAGNGGTGAAQPAPSSVSTGPAADSARAGVPRYYIALDSSGNPVTTPVHAVVRATATGAVLGTIQPSVPGGTIRAVTAAADDRTFVLDESKSGNDNVVGTRWFYVLRLSASGKPASLAKLPFTAGRLVTGVALSPDGSKLAVAIQPQDNPREPDLTELRVYTLATGAVRTWTQNNGVIGSGEDDAMSVSWTADGRELAFDWGPGSGPGLGAWLLDTTRDGSGLLAGSRLVVAVSGGLASFGCQTDEIVSGDGSVIICGAEKISGVPGSDESVEVGFEEFSTTTGKVIRTLYHHTIRHVRNNLVGLMWSSPSGGTLIVSIPGPGNGLAGILHGGTFTPLNVPDDRNPEFAGTW
jgi:hypothetical protein